jgi:hypothetical protein
MQTVRFYVNETRCSYASFNDVVDETVLLLLLTHLLTAAASSCSLCCTQTVRFYINETRRSYASFNDVVDEDVWIIYNDKIVFSGRHIHEDVSCNITYC